MSDPTEVTRAGSALRTAKHLLVCLRYGIGDVVMQLPTLHALRRAVPDARITAVGAAPAIELLESEGLVDEVVAYGRWGIRHLWDPGTQETPSRVAGWLEEAAFELVLAGAYAPQAILHAVKCTGVPLLSIDEALLLVISAGGANGTEALAHAVRSGWRLSVDPRTRPAIALCDSEVEFARVFLDQSGVSRPLVRFCPAASSKLKRWPESRFAAVAQWALNNVGGSVVLFGGETDESVAAMRRLISDEARCAQVRALPLRRVAAVLAKCAVLVSNDTGLMHIAAAVGTAVVAVFGPTSPRVYLPRGRAVGLTGEMECPHCAHSLNPPGCWESERCLVAPDNCTFAVHSEDVIRVLRQVLWKVPIAREIQTSKA